MKKLFVILLAAILTVSLVGCNFSDLIPAGPASDDTDARFNIYNLAVSSGYDGTYEQWLASVRGERGEDGKNVQLSVIDGSIAYRYEGDSEWISLITLSDLAGSVPASAFRINEGNIEWTSGGEWNTLISLAELSGADGKDGSDAEFTVDGGYIRYRAGDDSEWRNLVELESLAGKDGADGREIQLTVADGYVKYRYTGDEEWAELIEIASLIGAAGRDGKDGTDGKDGADGKDGKDGREVEFTVDGGYIKYKYTDELSWRSLISLELMTGADGKDGADGVAGADGKDGKTPTFRVENGILQWQYEGDTVWRDLFAFNSISGSGSADTKPREEYGFGEFVPLEELELVEVIDKNGIKTLKYKVGTMYYVPISYGFIQKLYPNTSLSLGYSLSEATEESIERGIGRTESVSVEFGLEAGGIETEMGAEISVERLYNYIQSTTNTEMYSGTYTVVADETTAGKYFRIALVTNIDYYVCYQYDAFDSTRVVRYTMTECRKIGDDYQFIAKLQMSDTEVFEEHVNDNTVFEVNVADAQLKADGLYDVNRVFTYEGVYKDADVITLDKYQQGGDLDYFLCSEVQVFSQIFGKSKYSINARNIPFDMQLSYTFTYNKVRNDSADMRVVVTNGLLTSIPGSVDTVDELVSYMANKVGVVADKTSTIPLGSRNKDTVFNFGTIDIPYDEVGDKFYVYLINTSNSEIEIKDHVYSYTLTPDLEELEQTAINAYRNTALKVYDGESKKDRLDFVNMPDATVEELIALGFTKLTVTITFRCEKRGALPPALTVVDSDNGKPLATPEITYTDSTFATTMQNALMSTTATATFTIDLTSLDDIDIALVWACFGQTGTTGTKYISTDTLKVVAYLSK